MITLEPPRRGSADADGPDDGWQTWSLSRTTLTRFVTRAARAAGLSAAPDVLLAGDRTLRRLNREWRGKNKATDVLSFPAPPELAAVHGGDLAISLETAARQADAEAHTLDVEVRVLLLHGMLHLAGMDHETDAGEMRAREASLRAALKLPGGLIERVEGATGKVGNWPDMVGRPATASCKPARMKARTETQNRTRTATAKATARPAR